MQRSQQNLSSGIVSYSYDSLSRLLSVLHQAGTVTLDGAGYGYDSAGNRTSKTNYLNNITESYTYDPIYQLTQVTQGLTTTESYSYDAVGNRLSSLGMSPYAYNSSNELTSTPSASFDYDSNGNTTTKVDASGTTLYTWDFENRLTSVTLPGAGGTVSFKYDPFGRRIQKASTSGTTNYLYDGNNSVEELDQAGAIRAHYAQTTNIDEPLAELLSGAAGFYEQDGLGSVTSLSNSTGAVLNSYVYDTFGNTAVATGSFVNPYLYTGRNYDSETGLRYYRARYYDPQTSRFLSEDPTRLGGGSPNFYKYANNNPILQIDPLGLCPTDDATDACHAQLSARIGLGGSFVNAPHLWWWISIGTQDYIISGTGTKFDLVNGEVLNAYVTPGTQSESNPQDKVGNGTVVFDTRDAHGGFASPDDCPAVLLMLYRALHYPNNLFPYDVFNPFDPMTSNSVAFYVGWPYVDRINAPSRAWGWATFLPGMNYPDYR